MKAVTRRATKPYCICAKGRSEGWTRDAKSDWVHPGCGKISRGVYEHNQSIDLGFFP